jgi:hypothetical protein
MEGNGMFHIPSYFQIVLTHSTKTGWQTPKAVSEGLSLILYPEVKSLMIDTFFNKFFKGGNKGKTLYDSVQEYLMDEPFTNYLYRMEKSFSSANYKNNKFDLEAAIEALLENIQSATNITGNMRKGLIRSYHLYHQSRPYLFLSEALYYALELQNNKNAEYHELQPDQQLGSSHQQVAWKNIFNEDLLDKTRLSARLLETINLMSEEEIDVFTRLAKLALTDEDGEPYLYAPVTDEEIALYKKYGMGNREFFMMEECHVINMGARIANTMEVTDGALYGFQNDNLVLAFTAYHGQGCTVEYKSYAFTSVGSQMLELLQADTNDDFFTELADIIKQNVIELPVKSLLLTVEEAEKLEDMKDVASAIS